MLRHVVVLLTVLVHATGAQAFAPHLSLSPLRFSAAFQSTSCASSFPKFDINDPESVKRAMTKDPMTFATAIDSRHGDERMGSRLSSLVLLPFHAIGKSAKVLVSSTAAASVLVSGSWSPLYYITGALCNAVLSKVLKRLIRQPRPLLSKKGGYGMPSSHAFLIFYFLTVVAKLSRQNNPGSLASSVGTALLAIYAVAASSWRVTDGLHSAIQTLVGATLGVSSGLFFHAKETEAITYLSLSLFPGTTSVPMYVKAVVLVSGGLALYFKELRALRKR